MFGGRERPVSSMGFSAVCKLPRAGLGAAIEPAQTANLHVMGAQVQGQVNALGQISGQIRPTSSGSIVKGLASRPRASTPNFSQHTTSRPSSSTNPFFMTSIGAENADYLDLEEMGARMSRSPSPAEGRRDGDSENLAGGVRLVRPREQRISDAIHAAQLGPQVFLHCVQALHS